MIERPKQRNCQQEPPYPGADTIIMSIRDPEWVLHKRCDECPCEYPHLWDRCAKTRMTENEKRMRAFSAMLTVGGLTFPIEKCEFKIDFFHKYGVIAPDKFAVILPEVT